MMLKVSLSLNTYLCILSYLLASVNPQQFLYPLPNVRTQQSTTTNQVQNPWGLQPLRSLPAGGTSASYHKLQQYQPPNYPPQSPLPPKYLPSQLNPPTTDQASNPYYPLPNSNHAPSSPNYSPPGSPSSSDIWSSWKNIGGAFRYFPGVDYSVSNGDIVAAFNTLGVLKVKSIGPSGTSSWITIAQPPVNDPPESNPAVVVSSNRFQVFMMGASGTIYKLTTAVQLPVSTPVSGSWTSTPSIGINNPAAILIGTYYYVFAIGRPDRRMYYATVSSTEVIIGFTPVPDTKKFIFSPTASTYTSNGSTRIVIAGVDYSGTLMVADTTTATATTLATTTFYATEVSCIESPESVSLGTNVEIYCRGKDMNFYCVTVIQGGIGDTRILPEADIPSSFKPVYNSQTRTVSVYSKTPAGRIVSKVFQSYPNTQQYQW